MAYSDKPRWVDAHWKAGPDNPKDWIWLRLSSTKDGKTVVLGPMPAGIVNWQKSRSRLFDAWRLASEAELAFFSYNPDED